MVQDVSVLLLILLLRFLSEQNLFNLHLEVESSGPTLLEATEMLSDLVGLDEPHKDGEEHGGRGGFRVLAEELHSRVVRVLQERTFGSNSGSSSSEKKKTLF